MSAPTAESRRIPWRPPEAQGTGRSRGHPGLVASSRAETRRETCGSPASAPASAGTFPGLKCACRGGRKDGALAALPPEVPAPAQDPGRDSAQEGGGGATVPHVPRASSGVRGARATPCLRTKCVSGHL